jgi:cyclase
MRQCFARGADKITINSEAVRRPALIDEASRLFGNQAVVLSIDAFVHEDGRYEVIDGGRTPAQLDPIEWAANAEQRGAGEVLLQVIQRDGATKGYDLDLIHRMSERLAIPLVACSGVGRWEHYAEGAKAGASALAAANLWHFKEHADRLGKMALAKARVSVRA